MKNITGKLQSRGAGSLTDEELISLVLAEMSGGDTRGVAAELMRSVGGSLLALADVDIMRLRMLGGIGMVRAARLKGAMELGRRLAVAEATGQDVVTSDSDVVRIMEPHLGGLQHEEC